MSTSHRCRRRRTVLRVVAVRADPTDEGELLVLQETYGFDPIPVACGADSLALDPIDDDEPMEFA